MHLRSFRVMLPCLLIQRKIAECPWEENGMFVIMFKYLLYVKFIKYLSVFNLYVKAKPLNHWLILTGQVVSSWDFCDACVLECINKLVLGLHALLNLNPSSVLILLGVICYESFNSRRNVSSLSKYKSSHMTVTHAILLY